MSFFELVLAVAVAVAVVVAAVTGVAVARISVRRDLHALNAFLVAWRCQFDFITYVFLLFPSLPFRV